MKFRTFPIDRVLADEPSLAANLASLHVLSLHEDSRVRRYLLDGQCKVVDEVGQLSRELLPYSLEYGCLEFFLRADLEMVEQRNEDVEDAFCVTSSFVRMLVHAFADILSCVRSINVGVFFRLVCKHLIKISC
jgi:hypothetical protein